MNLLETFGAKLEQMPEVPQNSLETLEIKNPTENEIFSEFGWNKEDFFKISGEFFLKEFDRKETAELFSEREKYARENLYHFSLENFVLQGPNCYAFAMQWDKNPVDGEIFQQRPLPGQIAYGFDSNVADKWVDLLLEGTPDEQKSFFKEMLSADTAAVGMECKEVDANYKPQNGEWVIAMATTENIFENPGSDIDFHFWRKGENGEWLHKPGVTEVLDKDSSGKLIFDPEKCDRGMYEHFLGYFAIKGAVN